MNNILKRIIVIIILIPILVNIFAPSSFAVKILEEKVNIISKEEMWNYRSGTTDFKFKVKKTGVYALEFLPKGDQYSNVAVFEYDYNTYSLNQALKKDEARSTADRTVYRHYSKDLFAYVLIAGKEYTIKENNSTSVMYIDDESYVSLRLTLLHEQAPGEVLYEDASSQHPCQPEVTAVCENIHDKSEAIIDGDDAPKTNLIEQLITQAFVYTIGDGIMMLIGVVAGQPITIENILFNQYPRTRLTFFNNESAGSAGSVNPFLSQAGIVPHRVKVSDTEYRYDEGLLNKYYSVFLRLAIVAYIVILLYMGIRIVLSSTGKDAAKYKKLFTDWVIGVMILFLFPVVMKYCIVANDAIVSYIYRIKSNNPQISIKEATVQEHVGGLAFPFSYVGADDGSDASDYMSEMRRRAIETGRFVYAICWFMMIKELIAFLIMYIKRMLMVLFLIVIFPFVAIYYAVDKIGDGKSQAFNHWFKEFVLNVFVQTFHTINYVVVMGIIFALTSKKDTSNFILILVGLTYIANGEKILRDLFSQMSGGGAGTVSPLQNMLKRTAMLDIAKSSVNTIRNSAKNIGKLNERRKKNSDLAYAIKKKEFEENKSARLNGGELMSGSRGGSTPPPADPTPPPSGPTTPPSDGGGAPSSDVRERTNNAINDISKSSITPDKLFAKLGDLAKLKEEDPNAYEAALDASGKRDEIEALMEQHGAIDVVAKKGITSIDQDVRLNLDIIERNRKGKLARANMRKLDTYFANHIADKDKENEAREKLDKKKNAPTLAKRYGELAAGVMTANDVLADRKDYKLHALEDEEKALKAELKTANDARLVEINNRLDDLRIAKNTRIAEMRDARVSARGATARPTSEASRAMEDSRRRFSATPERASDVSNMTAERANMYLARAASLVPSASQEKISEYQELAEAKAIIAESDSGKYTIEELWNADKKVREARKTSRGDAIAEAILGGENKKDTKQFQTMLATKVIQNASRLDNITAEDQARVDEAIGAIQGNVEAVKGTDEEEMMKYILEKSGINADDLEHLGEDGIPNLPDEFEMDEIDEQIAQEQKDIDEIMKKKEKDEKTIAEMKRELFQDRLGFTKDAAKEVVKPLLTGVAGGAMGAMYAGASGDYDLSKIVATASFGAKTATGLADKVIDFTVNTVDGVTNTATGIADIMKNEDFDVPGGKSRLAELVDFIVEGEDIHFNVKTRHNEIKKSNSALPNDEVVARKVTSAEKLANKRARENAARFGAAMNNGRRNT